MKLRLVASVELLRRTYESWRADRTIRLGAGLAYYAAVTAVPLLTTVLAVAGVLFSESEIRAFIEERVRGLSIEGLAPAIDELAGAVDASATVAGLTILSLVSGVIAASALFLALQDSFNVIWGVPVGRGLRYTVRRRMLAAGLVALIAGLFVALLIVHAIAVYIDELLLSGIDVVEAADDALVTLAVWPLAVATVAVLFQLLTPDVLPWKKVVIASAVTTPLLVVGTWAVGLYFRYVGTVSVTGLAGSLLVVLFWLFYVAQIVLAGAELLKEITTARAVPETGTAPS